MSKRKLNSDMVIANLSRLSNRSNSPYIKILLDEVIHKITLAPTGTAEVTDHELVIALHSKIEAIRMLRTRMKEAGLDFGLKMCRDAIDDALSRNSHSPKALTLTYNINESKKRGPGQRPKRKGSDNVRRKTNGVDQWYSW